MIRNIPIKTSCQEITIKHNVRNDENFRESKLSSYKLNTADKVIIPSIVNEEGNREFIDKYIIYIDTVTIEHELWNSIKASKYKKNSTSRTDVDNNKLEHEFKLKNSKIESKNKRYYISRNNLDIYTIEHECELQKGNSESKYKKYSTSKNDLNNDNMEQEFEIQNSKVNSKNEKYYTSSNNLDNNNPYEIGNKITTLKTTGKASLMYVLNSSFLMISNNTETF